jgi:hypothetical protein
MLCPKMCTMQPLYLRPPGTVPSPCGKTARFPLKKIPDCAAKYLDTYFCTFFLSHSQHCQWETLAQNMREFLSGYLGLTLSN